MFAPIGGEGSTGLSGFVRAVMNDRTDALRPDNLPSYIDSDGMVRTFTSEPQASFLLRDC